MFEGHTDKIVAQRPAPQAAPESRIARNEPEFDPGTEGPNIILRIDNP